MTIVDNGDGTPNSLPKPATGINLETDKLITAFDQSGVVKLPTQFAYRNVVIDNCRVNRNSLTGALTVNGRNIIMRNTEVNDTFMTQVAFGDIVSGCYFQSSNGIVVTNCTVNGTTCTDGQNIAFGAAEQEVLAGGPDFLVVIALETPVYCFPNGICHHGGANMHSISGYIAEPVKRLFHVRRGHGCLGTWQTMKFRVVWLRTQLPVSY